MIKALKNIFLKTIPSRPPSSTNISRRFVHRYAIYLYGLTMLCTGEKNVDETYINKIGWKQDHKFDDQCSNRFKKLLQ